MSKGNKTLWLLIQANYYRLFGIPFRITDYKAVLDIIRRCASGYSNQTIAYAINENAYYIKEVLINFLGFSGWIIDLDINPLAFYNRCHQNFDSYKQEVEMLSSLMDGFCTKLSFSVCEKYYFILGEIKRYDR